MSKNPVASIDHEPAIRRDLAAAFRWAARLDLHESIANHFSASLDERGEQFLINPRGAHFSQINASDLVRVNVNDAVHPDIDPTAWVLHGHLHRRIPRARCVLHTHMPHATALACLRDFELLMLDQNACRFHHRIAYDRSFSGMALDDGEGARVAALLGEQHDILFLGNHGIIVIADSVAQAFDELYYLEKAAQVQVLALSTGRELEIIPAATAARTCQQWREYPQFAELHFAALVGILDRESPEYRS
jgi:ribulose-5-phosphate 4-epimerase/fuculose-1-phosphate aldolase